MINLYFDAEFTGLHKDTTLISIGIVSASGESFYAELNDFADYQITPWIEEKGENKELAELLDKENTVFVVGSKYEVRESLLEWLKHFESDIQFVSDVSHYDFVLLVDLLASSALELPNCISASCHDINQDIARVLRISEKEAFDLSREQLLTKLGKSLPKGVKHNALYAMKGLIQSLSDEFGVRAERLWKQNETLKFKGCSLYDLHEFIDCYNPPEKKRKEKVNGCSEQRRKLPRRRNPRMVQPLKRAGCSSSKCKIL